MSAMQHKLSICLKSAILAGLGFVMIIVQCFYDQRFLYGSGSWPRQGDDTGWIVFAIVALLGIGVCFGNDVEPGKDPWDGELEADFWDHATPITLCHGCGDLLECDAYFCPRCGASTGVYNTVMPLLWVFSLGDLLLACTSTRFKPSLLNWSCILAISLAEYGPLAPWYLMKVGRKAQLRMDSMP